MAPVVAAEVAKMRTALEGSLVQAAGKVGKTKIYQEAMKEYAKAKRFQEVVDTAVAGAKKGAGVGALGAAGGGGYWITKELRSLLGGE